MKKIEVTYTIGSTCPKKTKTIELPIADESYSALLGVGTVDIGVKQRGRYCKTLILNVLDGLANLQEIRGLLEIAKIEGKDVAKVDNRVKDIIDYLNQKANTKYRYRSSKTISVITARLNEKFTVSDFETVIDKKVNEWRGTEFERFLRPDTLFGTKFEMYLNQKIIASKKTKREDILEHNYSKEQLNSVLTSIEDMDKI